MLHPLQQWAGKQTGIPPQVRVDDLELPPEAKDQLRAWGKQRPPVPGNPPAWVTDEASWERAKKAVEKYWDTYSEPWAVVTHVYQNMSGQ